MGKIILSYCSISINIAPSSTPYASLHRIIHISCRECFAKLGKSSRVLARAVYGRHMLGMQMSGELNLIASFLTEFRSFHIWKFRSLFVFFSCKLSIFDVSQDSIVAAVAAATGDRAKVRWGLNLFLLLDVVS
jgi:hypothetical protein